MENNNVLEGHSDVEKGAYLSAIASIATADRQASEDELENISALCDSANLSAGEKQKVLEAAKDESGENLTASLDILKTSDLKYSLITDLIAFANSDNEYSENEEQSIHKIAEYLKVDEKQVSVLNEVAQKASTTTATPEQAAQPNFLSSLGLGDKLQSAGINGGGLLRGLLSFAVPMILGRMVSGGLGRNYNSGGSGGGMLGNILGGGGGLGSVISMLNGGRGLGSAGGLFSRIFG